MSGGFLLLAAVLYYFDTGGILLWTGAACALHELGHYVAIRLWGGRVTTLRISCVGAVMKISPRAPLSHLGLLCSALAGPAANLLLAALAVRLAPRWGGSWYLFAGLNLGLAAFNLLPVAQLDGGRALGCLLALVWAEEGAKRVVGVCSAAVSVALILGGGVLVWQRRASATLLITAVWLFVASLPGAPGIRPEFS